MKDTCDPQKARNLEQALSLIGSKWTLLILYNLCFEKRGFNELTRIVPGISPRILSQRLQDLVRDNLVSKTIKPTNPPQVAYAITEKGAALKSVLEQLGSWAGNIQAK